MRNRPKKESSIKIVHIDPTNWVTRPIDEPKKWYCLDMAVYVLVYNTYISDN